ncbi:hypothetical protein EUCA11A_40020 [Eubacterium callanderi]|uniref:response regulator n=1 Tax=Eubacterium callanderi TaxID=53442 RepID=UPI0029FF2BDB|nr:response regulator [Eubacterium callanderi]WPK69812.1 hypothetical protein EUCA2A_40020 [Eubacterium callanderi]WPK74110.1 hypothetical protein EUCA11A_40020 [Eubacterium callanderi]
MLKTILVDNEPWQIKRLAAELEESDVFEVVGLFERASMALAYAEQNPVEFALLDIEMPGMNGIVLAEKLQILHPGIIIVFVTAYSQYVLDALKIKADYLVLKPYSKEDVEDALSRARLLAPRQQKRVFMRTFGSFEMFVDHNPVSFSSARAKELLAFLVDRRGVVSSRDMLAAMWEEKPYNDSSLSLCRVTTARLRHELEEHQIEELLVESRRGRSLDESLFDCDYYKFLDEGSNAEFPFMGEYMSQYSWAEMTLAGLLINWKNK